MRILFVMRHPGYVRNYEPVIRMLAARGHHVDLTFERRNTALREKIGQRPDTLAERLAVECPGVATGGFPKRADHWTSFAEVTRTVLDFLRYLHPDFAHAPLLRERAESRLRGPFRLLRHLRTLSLPVLLVLIRLLMIVERAIPAAQRQVAYLRERGVDVVLVTPVVELGATQVDAVKAGLAAGLPTAVCVASWDNLTNKGLIRLVPDLVLVWNEFQRREAIDYHLVPSDRVVATGAQRFDEWFERRSSTTREQFCRPLSLDPERPIVLFLCSSSFIAPTEVEVPFVRRWVEAIRASGDPALRGAGILIRPHFQNVGLWTSEDLSSHGNIAIWPRHGENPTTEDAKAHFYDSLYHSALVVGINTSAQIEAGILGRPVFTIEAEQFQGTQEGTLHYRYLVEAGGGLLRTARDLDEHVTQLADALADPADGVERARCFVEAFVRPHGLDVAGTPIVVEAIEALGARGRRPRRWMPLPLWPLRLAFWPLSFVAPLFVPDAERTAQVRGLKRTLRRFAGGLVRRGRIALRDIVSVPVRNLPWLRRRLPPAMARSLRLRKPKSETRRTPAEEQQWKIAKRAGQVLKDGRPIIIGPWLSEVGFEVLYWIPYVSRLVDRAGIDRNRLYVLSRGGTQLWYRTITRNYLDIFDLVSTDEFREGNEHRWAETGGQKQFKASGFDEELVEAAKQRLGLEDAVVLHPSLMFELFRNMWRQRQPLHVLRKYSQYLPWELPEEAPPVEGLPERYVAVRFYYNLSFPRTPRNEAFVRAFVRNLARTTDVVLLNSGLHIDDHAEADPEAEGRIHRIEALMIPATNLDVQTRVIARAQAFVGTYGGFSYLAPFYGVRSIGFFSDPTQFVHTHLDVAQRTFRQFRKGSFLALDVNDIDPIVLALMAAASAGNAEGAPHGDGARDEQILTAPALAAGGDGGD